MQNAKPNRQWGRALLLYIRRLKIVADIVAPVALVFFAYEADTVYHQVARTQQEQVKIQKHKKILKRAKLRCKLRKTILLFL
jgi:hypothetical protein